MLHEAIKQNVSFERMEETLRSTLEFMDADEGTAAKVEQFMHDKVQGLHDLADALHKAEDPEELYRMLAYFWIELRVEWDRYNNTMNYQLLGDGQQDPVVVAKGSACSQMLTWLEGIMSDQDLSALADFCIEPLDRIRAEVDRIAAS